MPVVLASEPSSACPPWLSPGPPYHPAPNKACNISLENVITTGSPARPDDPDARCVPLLFQSRFVPRLYALRFLFRHLSQHLRFHLHFLLVQIRCHQVDCGVAHVQRPTKRNAQEPEFETRRGSPVSLARFDFFFRFASPLMAASINALRSLASFSSSLFLNVSPLAPPDVSSCATFSSST